MTVSGQPMIARATQRMCPIPAGFGKVVFAGLLCFVLAGCGSLKPWVKPYQRGHLADPIMSMDDPEIAARYINHVYESREAGRGAEGSSGGGCGCN
jgi:hypothetical protein